MFPETSQYFLGSVGMELFFFFRKIFYIGNSMKIVQNTPKIEEKCSDVPKQFRVGPKKVGPLGFPENEIFFFWPYARWCQVNSAHNKLGTYKLGT